MESTCEVNNTPNKDNWESQSLKNQGNIYRAWSFLHQSSKPESTITSKTIEFKSIESQDDSGRCSKIITRHGMLKVALSTFLILLIISTSLSIFLVMKHVTKNDDPTKESNADHASVTSEEFSKIPPIFAEISNNFEIFEVAEAEISNISKIMTNQDEMLKSKQTKAKHANTLESPNEEEVDTRSPTIIQQEDTLEISTNEMSQALAESLKCSIRYSCEVLLVDDPVSQKYHVESVALEGGSQKNCTGENKSYSWCFVYNSVNQWNSNCNENSDGMFQLQNVFLLKFTKNHEFFGLNELSIPISCKVNRCKPWWELGKLE